MNPITHGYAEVNGVRLHYAQTGDPRRPLVLFVHGFPEFWYAWRAQLEAFSGEFHAVAPDTRGINLSSKPADVADYRAARLVEDLRQLIGALGHERCTLVAHDWGGAVAWNLASQHPQLIERLVIINSPHPQTFARELRDNPRQQKASDYFFLYRDAKAERVLGEDNFRRLTSAFAEWGRGGGKPLDEDTLALYRQAWAQPGALTGGLNYYRASPLRPPRPDTPATALPPELGTVHVPTLVIWGEQDTALVPELLDGLERWVPDLRVERIPQGSHWVVHEFPERVNALIRGFLG